MLLLRILLASASGLLPARCVLVDDVARDADTVNTRPLAVVRGRTRAPIEVTPPSLAVAVRVGRSGARCAVNPEFRRPTEVAWHRTFGTGHARGPRVHTFPGPMRC